MDILLIKLPPKMRTDDDLLELASANPELKFEMTKNGELVIMPPTGGDGGIRNVKISTRLEIWSEQSGNGVTFDSSTMFTLPNGAKRSPDASWVALKRWNALTPEQKLKFPPLCPDFVVELRSPTDSLKDAQAKMDEYREQGAKLGWLLDPKHETVYIYRPGKSVEVLNSPTSLSGENVLPGFELQLASILY
jgi:Uma2 family endonuclease